MAIRRTWVIGSREQLCVKNCGQTAADSNMDIFTAYMNSLSPTLYDVQ